jgi:hypothetical protein
MWQRFCKQTSSAENSRYSPKDGLNYFLITQSYTNRLLKKSLYGDRVANLAWDETQSQWLISDEIGFSGLPSEGSIYIKRTEVGFIVVLNAVDDQLYFATDKTLKEWFEEATQTKFDVQLLGQANWYLSQESNSVQTTPSSWISPDMQLS